MTETPIVLQENPFERIELAVWRYRGRTYVDIRLYFHTEAGAWAPTRKGVTIGLDDWPDFMDAIAVLDGCVRAVEPAASRS
jgi:hypothetical protein